MATGKKRRKFLNYNYFNDTINIVSHQPYTKAACPIRAAQPPLKQMEDQHLIKIEPPREGRPPEAVAQEIIHMIRTRFPDNTAGLCQLLRCDRQWIDQHLRPEVDHIFVTYYFRQYMVSKFPQLLEDDEADRLLHGFYFYSEKSLQDFWNTHASAERKTVIVDLAAYRNHGVSTTDLRQEYLYHQAAKPCQKEKQRHMARMEKLVNSSGLDVYRQSREKKVWASCGLPQLTRSLKLTTAAEYRRRNGLHSNASAMDHLFRKGAVRIKLGSRALWIVPDKTHVYPVAVQAPEMGEELGTELPLKK